MKYVRDLLAFTILFTLTANTAYAGSFAEKFKNFVLGPEAEAYSINLNNKPLQPELDDKSKNCMGCHNGSRARRIVAKAADAPYHIRGTQTMNHPVGMSYDKYAMKKPWGYKSRQLLNKNIYLVDGKVTCLSCHQVKGKSTQRLARLQNVQELNADCEASSEFSVGSTQTELCQACHTK
jgi:hypothetical protein